MAEWFLIVVIIRILLSVERGILIYVSCSKLNGETSHQLNGEWGESCGAACPISTG
jgi:hypothetical protein